MSDDASDNAREPASDHARGLEATRPRATASGWRPWLHLAATAGSAAAVIAASGLSLHHLRRWQLALAVIGGVVASAIERSVHRYAMHRHGRATAGLYRSHSGLHHRWHTRAEMEMRSLAELQVVLLKPWLVPAVVVALAPAALGLRWLGLPNLGGLLVLVVVGYILLYEAVHLLCHLRLPPRLAAAPGLAFVRRHHALHHDPRWMRAGNFNVVIPLWDALLGTRFSDEGPGRRHAGDRRRDPA